MGKALNDVLSVVSSFSRTLYISEDHSTDAKSDVLDELFQKLEDMKKSFEDYISSIITSKREMLDFLLNIKDEIDGFSSFFERILAIAKKFKTVILLTLIELSRHASLYGLLSGSLSDVKQIPNQISSVVSEGQHRYKELISIFDNSLNLYNVRFHEQSRVLDESLSLMQKVSVQVYESRKYHNEFLDDTGKKIFDVKALISDVFFRLGEFSLYGSELGKDTSTGEVITRELLIMKHSEQLNRISEFYNSPDRSGDYRSMMLVSLANEFKSLSRPGNSVEFF